MKKLITFTIILIALLFVFGEAFRFLALKFDPNEPKAVELLGLKNETYDIIFMGNSVTQQGINPAIIDARLGANSYNMAVGGASIFENELTLRNYLISNSKPKLIVYGMFVNESVWGESVRPTFRYNFDQSVVNQIKDRARENRESPKLVGHLNLLPLYRYRNSLEHALKFMVAPKGRSYSYYKGFLQAKVVGKVPETLAKHQAGINEKSYRSFMSFAKSQGIRTLLIELPNSKSFNDATLGRDAVLKIISEETDLGFVSFNHDFEQYTADMWVGTNHLNVTGADKFSDVLSDTLEHYYRGSAEFEQE